VLNASLVLRVWYRLRGEAWSAMGLDPVRRADVSEELEAAEISDPAERSRVRRLIAYLEDGYHRERQTEDKAEKGKKEEKARNDALAHYRAEFRRSQSSAPEP